MQPGHLLVPGVILQTKMANLHFCLHLCVKISHVTILMCTQLSWNKQWYVKLLQDKPTKQELSFPWLCDYIVTRIDKIKLYEAWENITRSSVPGLVVGFNECFKHISPSASIPGHLVTEWLTGVGHCSR